MREDAARLGGVRSGYGSRSQAQKKCGWHNQGRDGVRAESEVLATSPYAAPDTRFRPLRAEAGLIDTATRVTEATATPMRARLEVGSAGDSIAEIDEELRQFEIVPGTIRVSAARAAGLVASLLTATPASRHVDPLPVLGRDPETEDEDEAEIDHDKRADEHRARWVLDEQQAQVVRAVSPPPPGVSDSTRRFRPWDEPGVRARGRACGGL